MDRTQRERISRRALLLGLLLTVPNTYWITVVEVRWYTLDGTSLPLFITPIFFLFCLSLANIAVKRVLNGRLASRCFTQQELLTVYITLVVGTVLAGHDLYQNLFGAIAHAAYYEAPENHWKSLFFAFLPHSWLVQDRAALRAYYLGNANPYDAHYWQPFVLPLILWALFISTLIAMCGCLNVLIKEQWTSGERLSFPIVQLPLVMTANDDSGESSVPALFRSKLMWVGFSIAALIDVINGLHTLYPSLPYLALVKQYNLGQFLNSRPWSAIKDTNMAMYPFAIGLAFFVPLDLSFSCWFFFAARKLFQVYGAATGLDGPGNAGFPYFQQQASGAWIAWGIVIVWALRKQAASAYRAAFCKGECASEALRMQYRGSFVGLAAGTVALALFSALLGLSFWTAALFFCIYFLLAIIITRVRAELGTPHEIYFVNPRLIMVTLFGTQAIGAQALTALSVMYWFNRGYRCHAMPNQMEAMQMGEQGRMRSSSLLWLLLVAFLWGTLVAYWANLHVTFSEGAAARSLGFKKWVGSESYDQLSAWLQTPARVNVSQLFYMAAGFLMVLFLRIMRSSFLWWPFHPAGYALSVSFAMDYFWFCFFIAWLAKAVLVRFGGMRAYNAAIPLFLGLVLGDYIAGSLWALVGPVLHITTYKIYI
jgi:hypothetical protein